MEESTVSFSEWSAASKVFAARLLTIAENRLELLTVEVQEERERLLRALLLALGVATFGLLAGITLTGALVVLFWAFSPPGVLLTLTCLYGGAAFWLSRQLTRLMSDWQTLSASMDELRKDRACLEKMLA